MKLSQLQMTGFKSFRNSTSIYFDKGITGIVGPNGCGKSNIVDAILWAMGGATAFQLRGRQMEDIIFSGSHQYPHSHYVEVILTLEKDDKNWPDDFQLLPQLEIKRKLKKGEDSQYFINNQSCLLKNIQNLFMDTGIQNWSIVEQDTISHLISSKPDQLREVIEQVAGTAQFKNKKKSAQNKLKNTIENLTRINDILNEQKKYLKKLEKQAHQAQSYKEIKNKIRNIEIFLLKNLYMDIKEKIQEKNEKNQNLTQEQNKLKKNLMSCKIQYQKTRQNSENIYSQFESQKNNLKINLDKLNQSEINIQKLQTLIRSKTEVSSHWKSNTSAIQTFQTQKLKQMNHLKNEIQSDINQIHPFLKSLSQDRNSIFSSLIQKLNSAVQILEEWSQKFITQKSAEFLKKSNLDQKSVQQNQLELKKFQKKFTQQKKDYEKQIHIQNEMEKNYQDKISLYKNLENEISNLTHSLNSILENKHKFELEIEALVSEKKNLEEKTWENHQIDLASLPQNQDETEPANESDLNQLKHNLSRIGQVNLLALNEYEELKTEHENLIKQYNDLDQSRKNLNQVINEMEKISSEKFKKTFNDLNTRLNHIFTSIFNGGSAGLALTQEKNGLGVEILACPPGKKLKNLKLLSGGEKSLTALSMIAALFFVRPSPFCILDEVDAALDDVNVARFNSLIREISKKRQVILVTHNKYSMKECHRLYGITMEEKGVSLPISVDMKESELSL